MNTPPLPNITSDIAAKLSDNTLTDVEIEQRRKQKDVYRLEYKAQGFHEMPIAYKTTSRKEFGINKLNRRRK